MYCASEAAQLLARCGRAIWSRTSRYVSGGGQTKVKNDLYCEQNRSDRIGGLGPSRTRPTRPLVGKTIQMLSFCHRCSLESATSKSTPTLQPLRLR
jgi:hypothetical protein